MGTHSHETSAKCKKCNSFLVEYHKKSPWIDDFDRECPKCEPGEAMERLRSWERRAAHEDSYEE